MLRRGSKGPKLRGARHTPNRKSHDGKPAASREQVITRSARRFAEADVHIADIKEKGAEERRRGERAKKEKGGA
jgi:hypothetical protein